jgi:hypothetical protein
MDTPKSIDYRNRIDRQADVHVNVGAGMVSAVRHWGRGCDPWLWGVLLLSGCCAEQKHAAPPAPLARVLAVAPVIDLSGSGELDPLKITDLVASEFLAFENVAVVPVNLVLAELERAGKSNVESADDAVSLAQALGADATIVVAITEYRPYSPPVVGMVMQWYAARPDPRATRMLNPVAASRAAHDFAGGLSEPRAPGLERQVQRVFNAADEQVLEEVRDYADDRDGDPSPYGWRKYTRSQELYVRYCGWAMIRTMLELDRVAQLPPEAKS